MDREIELGTDVLDTSETQPTVIFDEDGKGLTIKFRIKSIPPVSGNPHPHRNTHMEIGPIAGANPAGNLYDSGMTVSLFRLKGNASVIQIVFFPTSKAPGGGSGFDPKVKQKK
jgi:hypothetical protein